MKSLLIVLFAFALLNAVAIKISFTNLKCQEFHPEFAFFQKCRLVVVKRGVVALNVHVKLLKVPVNNVSFKIIKLFLDVIMKESNLNHSCPYDHDIIVDNLILDEHKFSFFPLPRGDYMFQLKVAAYNDWKALVRAYVNIDGDL
ncbi:uncharacterized protein [Musca autumnalis]|uniref:uncharacterized protein n=1 Tax=Musca autumnalis TaxID=221902 RepID=UPI003CE8D581